MSWKVMVFKDKQTIWISEIKKFHDTKQYIINTLLIDEKHEYVFDSLDLLSTNKKLYFNCDEHYLLECSMDDFYDKAKNTFQGSEDISPDIYITVKTHTTTCFVRRVYNRTDETLQVFLHFIYVPDSVYDLLLSYSVNYEITLSCTHNRFIELINNRGLLENQLRHIVWPF